MQNSFLTPSALRSWLQVVNIAAILFAVGFILVVLVVRRDCWQAAWSLGMVAVGRLGGAWVQGAVHGIT